MLDALPPRNASLSSETRRRIREAARCIRESSDLPHAAGNSYTSFLLPARFSIDQNRVDDRSKCACRCKPSSCPVCIFERVYYLFASALVEIT